MILRSVVSEKAKVIAHVAGMLCDCEDVGTPSRAVRTAREIVETAQEAAEKSDGLDYERVIAAAIRVAMLHEARALCRVDSESPEELPELDELHAALVGVGEIPDETPEDKRGGAATPPER